MKQATEKIRALIVDDEPIARRGIRANLKAERDVEIVGECANGREAVAAIEREKPDLIFLDIQMPVLDGFGVVEAVGAENLPAVVFVTAFDEHAIRAFEINALDYLLKPVDPERFQKTLNRVRTQIKNSQTGELSRKISALLENTENSFSRPERAAYLERIAVKGMGRITFLTADEISWISSDGNYVKIHAAGKTHLLRETMDAMERRLDPQKFLRVRRSAIVRIEKIKELQPLFNGEFVVILNDGARLTSSRRYRQNLDALLKN
jgi:two-component system LytT family response regulator